MSFLPDMTTTAHIHVPGNAQDALKRAIYALHKARPDLFEGQQGWVTATTMWDLGCDLTEDGGRFLADLITAAIATPNPR